MMIMSDDNSVMVVYQGNTKEIEKIKLMASRHVGIKPFYEGKGSEVKKLQR
jgi:hypothetical protein